MNSKDTRLFMAAVVGAVLALLVGYLVETSGRSPNWTLAFWMERGSSWVVWVTAGAVLGGFGYMLLNRDDRQP